MMLRGLLMPRVALISPTNSSAPVANPATGLVVYNTASVNDVSLGFCYWDGMSWVQLATGEAWLLEGNSRTTPWNGIQGNFLGMTDAQPLAIAPTNAGSPQPIPTRFRMINYDAHNIGF